MLVHQVYAMIDEEGVVQNVMVCENYEEANRLTRAVYGDKAVAVDCLQYACCMGDRYHDGWFWRPKEDGTEERLPYIPTEEQMVQLLKAQQDELTIVLADVLGGAM